MQSVSNSPKVQDFDKRMLQILNNGALSLAISLGHRTGLYDLMSKQGPSTSRQIAEASKLNERYVREWLNTMVSGEIIQFDPDKNTYLLPEEHAKFLTREARAGNIASIAQFIPLLGCVEDEIFKCFSAGGGVPYSAFGRFHEVMAEESAETVVPYVANEMIDLAQGLRERLGAGINVLDIGCGRGKALCELAANFPSSNFTGYDISKDATDFAIEHARSRNLTNVRFNVKDVATLDEKGHYELITAFDAIHDQAKPKDVLKGVFNSLHDRGIFLMQDIDAWNAVDKNMDHPIGPFLYTVSLMHCMTVSLAQEGEGLGTMWGKDTAQDFLKETGFKSVTVEKLPHDILNCIFIARK